MNILIFGFLFFFISFGIHVLVWRIRVPLRQAKALLLIFVLPLMAPSIPSLAPFLSSGWDWFYSLSIHFSLFFAYLISLPAVESESPSSLILLELHRRPEGVSLEDLKKIINDDRFILNRLEGLFLSGHAAKDSQGKIVITESGQKFMGLFMSYRGLLRLTTKGG